MAVCLVYITVKMFDVCLTCKNSTRFPNILSLKRTGRETKGGIFCSRFF